MKHLPRQIPVICVATDVTPAPDWRGYDVAVYAPGDDLPAKDPATGLYALPAGNPVKTLSVRRENGGKRAVVTILRGGADPLVSVYDYAMGDWSLTRPSGVREEKERQVADSRAARIVTTVRTPQGDTVEDAVLLRWRRCRGLRLVNKRRTQEKSGDEKGYSPTRLPSIR